MGDKKRSVMKKWKRTLIAAALTASMILALPVWNVGSAQADETKKTSSKTYIVQDSMLKIKRAGTTPQGTIVVDLYRVADVEEDANYDGYELVFSEAQLSVFGAEIAQDLRDAQDQATDQGKPINGKDANKKEYNEDYRNLAEAMTRKVITTTVSGNNPVSGNDPATSLEPYDSIEIGATTNPVNFAKGLPAGMYLVIAHGKDLSPDEYVGMKNGKLVTMAYNNGYVYNYLPELIALPMRWTNGNAPQGAFTTAQNAGGAATGDWQYEVTAELKAEEEIEMRDLVINKEITGVPEGVVIPGNDGFVYRIDAWINGLQVYSEVVAIDYKGAHTVTLSKKIPANADRIRITEVYDGGAFNIASDPNYVDITPDPDDETNTYTATFTNNYNQQGNNGGVVVNHFATGDTASDTDDGYKWEAVSGNDLDRQTGTTITGGGQ